MCHICFRLYFYDCDHSNHSVWLLFVTVISGSAACGIFIIPYIPKKVYDKVLTWFVALGVGTLSESAVFHLLPQVVPEYVFQGWWSLASVLTFINGSACGICTCHATAASDFTTSYDPEKVPFAIYEKNLFKKAGLSTPKEQLPEEEVIFRARVWKMLMPKSEALTTLNSSNLSWLQLLEFVEVKTTH
uniref:MFS domain-containing protein n=1 Tax=Steinernema glaseri TaxID=37863 RepID=A0A1I8ALZ2_9BILA